MFTETNYREILRDKLAERIRSNPSYSMRAMARDLDVSPSRLSQILQGKQGISDTIALQFAKSLKFTELESEFFCTLVESNDARSKIKRQLAQLKLKHKYFSQTAFHQVEVDVFKTISDWYHLTILELTTVKGFKSDISWIASRLGISQHEAREAIERLKRLGLLKIQGKTFVQTHHGLSTQGQVPSEAIRKFHQQVMELGIKSIHGQTMEERDLSSLIVGIRKQDVPKFKKQIADFRRNFNESVESVKRTKKAEEVYCLGLQFFRLTQKELR